MEQQQLIPHLFRTEYRKITAVLCKLFGIEHIEVAEDIAGDTFLSAVELWGLKGLPDNPRAWLYAVAKNKARNYFRRDRLFAEKIRPRLLHEAREGEEFEIDLNEAVIRDSQLQMMFALCDPVISAESQVALALRLLCGFGIGEIAAAFLTTDEVIIRRLYRARQKLRAQQAPIVFPATKEMDRRLETVLTALYLLFNEGYCASGGDRVLRKDLCLEAMRLTNLLTEHLLTHRPEVDALMALMSFQASRFEARVDGNGDIVLYADQDESLWDRELIIQGKFFLDRASQGTTLSRFHLEAGIAWWHTIKEDSQEKWENILQLYNHLLVVEYSPMAALNRTYALSRANSVEEAIREAEKLGLAGNHLYHALLGELYKYLDMAKALLHLEDALRLARSGADRQLLEVRIRKLRSLAADPRGRGR